MDLMVNSWLVEIAQYLHSNNAGVYGSTPTANIFTQQLPDSPVLAIGVFVAGGPAGPEGIDPLDRPNLQVLIRRTKNIDGLQYAATIFSLLDNKWNITPSFNGRLIGDHLPGPFYLSGAGYPVYTLNFSSVITKGR